MYSTMISVNDAIASIGLEDVLFIDCRFSLADTDAGEAAYLDSHIPGAVYLHLDRDLSSAVPVTDRGRHPLPSVETMSRLFDTLGITPQTQVIAYDDTKHAFASRLWWMLRFCGHDRVAVLDGGWSAWLRQEGPVDQWVPVRDRSGFVATPRADRLVVLSEVESQSLIDSRAPGRFRGEVEPIDPRAGHIPGAVNFHFAQALNEQGEMRPKEALQALYKPVLGETAAEDSTFYCGSGVTACVNILAVAHAGLGDAKLYVGSWSEWSSDPDRPGAVGE